MLKEFYVPHVEEDGTFVAGNLKYSPDAYMYLLDVNRKPNRGSSTLPWEREFDNIIGRDKLYENNVRSLGRKDRMKWYTEEIGMSPKPYLKFVSSHRLHTYFSEDLKPIARKFCRQRRGHYNPTFSANLKSNEEVVVQTYEDGLHNLIPFLMVFKDIGSIRNLRKLFGKGLWKKLCSNSKTRNLYIAWQYNHCKEYVEKSQKEIIGKLNTLPSTLLRPSIHGRDALRLSEYSINYLVKNRLMGRYKKIRNHFDVSTSVNIIEDTVRLSDRLDLNIPARIRNTVDYQTWVQYHDELVDMYNQQMGRGRFYHRYRRTPAPEPEVYDFSGIEEKYKDFRVESDNYYAIVLTSQEAIEEEGKAQHHCVGGYVRDVAKGTYLVVSIRSKENDKRFSTLGLYIRKKKDTIDGEITNLWYEYSQHYKACNKRVDSEEVYELAKQMHNDLNGMLGKGSQVWHYPDYNPPQDSALGNV